MTLGVDVSRWQGEIDWGVLRAGRPDVRFAYVRAGGGNAGKPPVWQHQIDSASADNLFGARYQGVTVGGYVPFAPKLSTPEEAAVEALTYLATVGFLEPGMLVPALDIEDTTKDWSAWTVELIRVWRRLTRRVCHDRVILYSSGSFFGTYLPAVFDSRVGVWVAHHNGTPGVTPYGVAGRAVLHQYTGKGTLPGVSGDVDLDATMPGVTLADWVIEA